MRSWQSHANPGRALADAHVLGVDNSPEMLHPVLEWFKGMALRPLLARLEPDHSRPIPPRARPPTSGRLSGPRRCDLAAVPQDLLRGDTRIIGCNPDDDEYQ